MKILALLLFAIAAGAQAQAYKVAVSWNAPVASVDPVVGYNVYRRPAGGNFVLLNKASGPITATSYIDLSVVNGSTYIYYVTSVDQSGVESIPSPQVTAVIACGSATQPCAPTGAAISIVPQ